MMKLTQHFHNKDVTTWRDWHLDQCSYLVQDFSSTGKSYKNVIETE